MFQFTDGDGDTLEACGGGRGALFSLKDRDGEEVMVVVHYGSPLAELINTLERFQREATDGQKETDKR